MARQATFLNFLCDVFVFDTIKSKTKFPNNLQWLRNCFSLAKSVIKNLENNEAQTKHSYWHMINALKTCHLNTFFSEQAFPESTKSLTIFLKYYRCIRFTKEIIGFSLRCQQSKYLK